MLDPENNFVPRLFHWTHAEVSNIAHANARHSNSWKEWEKTILWTDMHYVFLHEPVVVKGALNFKLKSIGNAMHKLGLFDTHWDNEGPSDGLDAMISAINLYKKRKETQDMSHIEEDKLMIDIAKYNEIDCKIIWEIVNYLRDNNCKPGEYEYDLDVSD